MAFHDNHKARFLQQDVADLGQDFLRLFGEFGLVKVKVNIVRHEFVNELFYASAFGFQAF